MYKKEYHSKSFLRTEKDVLDRIDYSSYDEPEELRKYLSEIQAYDLITLIEEIERIDNIEPYNKVHKEQQTIAKELIGVRLGLGFEVHYLIDKIEEELEQIEKAFKEVKELKHQFTNHRHDKDKNYTEKPVW